MKSSKRLQTVVNFTASQEQDAANLMAEQLRVLDTSKKRLADLLTYRAEYQRKLLEESAEGIAVSRVIDFQGFMANLARAIDQQTSAIEDVKKEYENKKRQWLAAHQRTNAISTVLTRNQTAERYQENRKLQKEMDDRIRKPKSTDY